MFSSEDHQWATSLNKDISSHFWYLSTWLHYNFLYQQTTRHEKMFTDTNLVVMDENAAEEAKGNSGYYVSQTLRNPCFGFLKIISVVFLCRRQ